ncbi:uncharacterized protein SETTUDRAFT_33088 [Exserohilum turcica Et28A]|uniref:Uncharacterized protein n=1 Tax=Exserohilum turcicum (strain 28A) TaxID=671987 RepID=R0K3D4_EXST2|nr:uncharacterized protein SETTUDRAFT_33088 [Exserohilum turcica Et28A]EOA84084.1 hypothetical protein SETTUDRAFT_33088 [Exserohilum turcica Et28A]
MAPTHPTPHATLLSTTLSVTLPSHYTTILSRWTRIASLHHSFSTDLLATDRANANATLKTELTLLEHDIGLYKEIVDSIDITCMARLYVVSGMLPDEALKAAKDDLKGLEESLGLLRERIGEVRADVRYGV